MTESAEGTIKGRGAAARLRGESRAVAGLEHPVYRPDIDGLRGLAVTAVVAFHAFPSSVRGGFTGVDIFFVISGFLISTIILESLANGTFSFLAFYQRRVQRIFPALVVVMLSSWAFGWLALLGDEFMQLGKHMAAGAAFVLNFVLSLEAGYFDNSAETKPLLHLWSLAIEEQFYIFWPSIVLVFWAARRFLAALIFSLIAASFTLNVIGVHSDTVGTFFSPLTRAWELLFGALLAQLVLATRRRGGLAGALAATSFGYVGAVRRITALLTASRLRWISEVLSVLGMSLVLFSFFGLHDSKSFRGLWAAPPSLAAVCLITAGPATSINRFILSQPFMVWVGLIRYPLYLWHWPLLSFARIIEGEMPGLTSRNLAVAASVLLAWLTHYAIERPLRFGSHGGAKTLVLLAAMAVVAALGFDAYVHEGHATRPGVVGLQLNKQELVRTPATDEGCLAFIGVAKPLFHYCRFTDAGSDKTIAVIGDSHAHVAYPGIAEQLEARGINTLMIANSSCPPLVGAPIGSSAKEIDACAARVEQLLDVLRRRPEIKTVIMFTRGMIYITGTEPVTGDRDVMFGATLAANHFASGLQRTIDRLADWGKSVNLVTENPELDRKPDACIPRPFRSVPKSCQPSLDTVLARQAIYRDIIAGLRNVTVIDSIPAFCSQGQCRVTDEDRLLLYADADHLSVAGSRFQARWLLARIEVM